MKLQELIEKVKEDHLDRSKLEDYHTALCNLKAELRQELATLKKEKARFMLDRQPNESVASRKIAWDASTSGQRMFEVEGYIGTTKDLIEGVKTRLYSIY